MHIRPTAAAAWTLLGIAFACVARAQPTGGGAATAPATAPATVSLANGQVVIVPPAGWTQVGQVQSGKLVAFASPHVGQMVVNVDAQETSLAGNTAAAT